MIQATGSHSLGLDFAAPEVDHDDYFTMLLSGFLAFKRALAARSPP